MIARKKYQNDENLYRKYLAIMAMAACPWACFATGGGGGALSATHQRESRAKFSCNSRTSAQFSGGPDLGAMCVLKEEQREGKVLCPCQYFCTHRDQRVFGRWACLLVSGVGECRRRWWWWGWSQHPRQAAPGPPPATQCPAISADYHPTHRQHCSSSTASSSTCTMSWLLFRDP